MNEYFKKIFNWGKERPWHAALLAGGVAVIVALSNAYLPAGAAATIITSVTNVVACGDTNCPVSTTTP